MGLPPTTSKIGASKKTTFNYEFPNFTGTQNGVTATLDINSVAGGGTGASTSSSARDNLGTQAVFNGIEDKTKVATLYNASTRVLTVTYTGITYVTVTGTRYAKTGSESTTAHAATNGKWYFYYDNTGALTVNSSVWDLSVTAPLEMIHYNGTPNNASVVSSINIDERHPGSLGMDNATHSYLHNTRGTQAAGASVAAVAAGTTTKTINVAVGTIYDEDNITASNSVTAGVTNIRKFFRKAATTTWDFIDDPLTYVTSGATLAYDNGSGTLQTLSASPNNTWINNYVVLMPTISTQNQVCIIVGQATHTSLAAAQAEDPTTALSNYSDLTSELVFISRLTFRKAGNTASTQTVLESAQAIRFNTVAGSATTNFMDLATNQIAAGNKTFTGITTVSSFISAVASPTTTYNATSLDNVILADCTSAGFTVTLPTAVGFTGLWFRIKKTDATVNALTIATTSSQTIDGETSIVFTTPYQGVTVLSNGTNWSVIS